MPKTPRDASADLPPPTALERASEPVTRRLAALPPALPVGVVLALTALGVVLPGWGWALLVVVVLVLGWTLAVSWPRLTRAERLMRIAVLALVLAVTLVRALPR